MDKRLLVSEKLLCDVIILLNCLECDLDYGGLAQIKHLCSEIEAEIDEKLDKMKRRETFTAYKITTPSPEREALRRDYIELMQIRKSFTSRREIPYCLLK